ncbi:MAG: cytochrome c oxidase assembly protein [Pararhodobacter sp.]|nr:cytochrome c oxidase assembly protein [Pararhodobacter sp.]
MARTDPYCGPAPLPETLLRAWNADPWLLAALATAGFAGIVILRRQREREGTDAPRPALAGVAMAGMVIAFVSPLCALTVALFSARTVHHLVLLGLVGPALALTFPLTRHHLGAWFVMLSAALWAWHVPMIYAAAWESAPVYWLMQLALVGSAWGFWSAILHPGARVPQQFGGALMVAALAGQMGLIGAILTFSPQLLYPEHLVTTSAFGLSPLADQQLSGLIMWVPGMAPLAALAALMLRRAWCGVQTA